MNPIHKDDAETQSADIVAENVDTLRQLFPEAFTEGRIDFEVLKQLLGGAVDERDEKYGLNWHGKRKARQIALTPSTGTLRPCPDESVDWDTTQNLMIEGDNLEVLKLLQKSYAGKVKLIYIDPPYNTGKDFVYPDDFQDNIRNYLELTGQVDGEGRKIGTNTEASGRFHTDWLNMMYPRLKLARNLMQDDGLIFVSIDDSELVSLRSLADEVFGSENFVACFIWEKRTNRENRRMVSSRHDYIVCYCKDAVASGDIIRMLPMDEEAIARYRNPDNDPRGLWKSDPATAQAGHATRSQFYTLVAPNGRRHEVQSGRCWLFTEPVMKEAIANGRIWFGQDGNGVPRVKTYLTAKDRGLTPESIWFAAEVSTNENAKKDLKEIFDGQAAFDTPKPVGLVAQMLKIADPDAVVLDFFAGSGTTAHAVLAQNAVDGGNRRYIVVQLPEPLDANNQDQETAAGFCDTLGVVRNIAELTKERLRRAGAKVARKLEAAKQPTKAPDLFSAVEPAKPIPDLGFRVFKLATSNIQAWLPDRTDIAGTLEAAADHLKLDRTEQDILCELLLKRGLDLCVPVEKRSIAGKDVYAIGVGVLMACLAKHISRADVEALAMGIVAWRKELNPAGDVQVIFRDSAFVDDVAKSNLTAILCQYGFDEKGVRSL